MRIVVLAASGALTALLSLSAAAQFYASPEEALGAFYAEQGRNFAKGLQGVNEARARARKAVTEQEQKLQECGSCPERAAIQEELDQARADLELVLAAEATALRVVGLGEYQNFEDLGRAIFEDMRWTPEKKAAFQRRQEDKQFIKLRNRYCAIVMEKSVDQAKAMGSSVRTVQEKSAVKRAAVENCMQENSVENLRALKKQAEKTCNATADNNPGQPSSTCMAKHFPIESAVREDRLQQAEAFRRNPYTGGRSVEESVSCAYANPIERLRALRAQLDAGKISPETYRAELQQAKTAGTKCAN